MYADKTLEILGEYYVQHKPAMTFEKFVEFVVHSKWGTIECISAVQKSKTS